jgi:hypothetical protein
MTTPSGGDAIPVAVSTDAPKGLSALPAVGYTAATLPAGIEIEGGNAVPVYLVSAAQIASGEYALLGEAAPVRLVAGTGQPTIGDPAPVPVYLVSGSLEDAAPWYNDDWGARTQLRINGAQVAEEQADFPVLVSATRSTWRSTGNGGRVAQTDGDDLLFTSSDGTTKLAHEIERYDPATGELVAWVLLPSLPAGEDTDLYLYYGNADAANQQDPTAVWPADYRGVWHMSESGTVATLRDSTSNNFDGTATGTITGAAGEIAGGLDFTAATNWFDCGNGAPSIVTGAMTVSFWINPEAYTNTGAVIGKQSGSGLRSWVVRLDSGGNINFNISPTGTTAPGAFSAVIPLDEWTHIAAVYTPSTSLAVFVNGVLDEAGQNTTSIPASQHDNGLAMLIGKRNGCDPCEIQSLLDEVRLQTAARSAGWLLTEYRNQSAPGTFMSVVTDDVRS